MDGQNEPSSTDSRMDLTLGLVTLNEEGTISDSLGALLSETKLVGVESELIVVAGGQDGTVDIVQTMLSAEPRARMVVDAEPRGKPAALNTIFSQCLGNVVVLTDGDVMIGPGAIEPLLRAFDDPEVGCASGRVIGRNGNHNCVMKASSLICEMMHLSRKERYKSNASLDLASGYLLAVRRALVDQIPLGVNSDDGYISCLVLSKGHRIAYAEDAIVYINFPRNVSDFVKQKMRTRYGHMQLEDYFGRGAGRAALGELRDFLKYLKTARRTGSHGPEAALTALFLVTLCWLNAYSRRIAPFLFRSPVWQPIKSTK